MREPKCGYDLAVIGSGAAGFAAAISARAKGRSVVMIERGTTGGTCVNSGCVPSKALLAAAETRHRASTQPFPGIGTTPGPVDLPALMSGKDTLVEGMRAEKYVDLAAEHGWEIIRGTAAFTGTGDGNAMTLRVARHDGGTTMIEATHYVIATGSAPWAPAIDGLVEAGYLTSTTAMELQHLPGSMIVIGGNAVGLEQAQLFAHLGTKVTVVEALNRLAPFEEPEVSAVLEGVLRDSGIDLHTATRVTTVRRAADGYTVTATRGGQAADLHAERLLVATGRRPVTDGLALASVGVKTGERGEILVDEQLRTTNPRIWAAGDVTGHPQYVYVAAAHGRLVTDNALDDAGRALDYRHLPRVTFTTPAIAAVGMTDGQAVERGYACDCRVLPLTYVPRALVNRDTRGLIKLVAERGTGRLLGAHVVAESAGEVITAASYALSNRMTVQQLAESWSPYLTMAEGLKLAAQSYNRDVSMLSCCA